MQAPSPAQLESAVAALIVEVRELRGEVALLRDLEGHGPARLYEGVMSGLPADERRYRPATVACLAEVAHLTGEVRDG